MLPKLILDALSHRCGGIKMVCYPTTENSRDDEYEYIDEFYWYMHDGYAELVKAYLESLVAGTQLSSGVWVMETDPAQWDMSRPIQLDIKHAKKVIRLCGGCENAG